MEDSKTEVQYLWANDKESLKKYSNIVGINASPEPIKCEYCGKMIYSKGMIFLGHIIWLEPNCKCEESIKAKKIAKTIRNCKI